MRHWETGKAKPGGEPQVRRPAWKYFTDAARDGREVLTMRGKKKTLFAVAALALAAALMLGLWYFTRPQTQAGDKTVVVEVVHGDGSGKEFEYRTDEEYLGPLLVEEKLAEGEQSATGLFVTTVDGETARDDLRQWWCVTRGGEWLDTGVDATPITDGDHFELTMSTY